MTRKEKVYRALKTLSDELLLEDIDENSSIGFDAETISNITDIDRSNVSRELNDLVREGRAFKIIGRPVLFLARESLEEIIPVSYDGDFIFHSISDFLEIVSSENLELTTDGFVN